MDIFKCIVILHISTFKYESISLNNLKFIAANDYTFKWSIEARDFTLMSRGLGSMQRAVLEALKSKGGRTSTRILLNETEIKRGKKISFIGFYRALNGLQDRGLVSWVKEHGGPNSPSGLVSITRTNVLLADVDSTIANLALMKISSWHKMQGHNVDLQRGLHIASSKKYDFVYISCLFTWNASQTRKLAKQFSDSEVRVGGSGVSLSTVLPDEMENLCPDYSLYPECDYSLGYTSRGCSRSCGFCLVPKMKYEGKPHAVTDIDAFYNPRFKKMILLDNNIFSVPNNHFERIARQIIKKGIQIQFNAGLDIRLIDDKKASLLKKMHVNDPRFAWDNIEDEYLVLRGIEILRRNGINRSIFYVLVGYEGTFEDCLYRVNKLRDLGQRVFVMAYNQEELFKKDRRYFYLRHWTNARAIFAACTYEEYVKNKENDVQKPTATA